MTLQSTKARLTLATPRTALAFALTLVLVLATLGDATTPAVAAGNAADATGPPGCLPSGNGYLRARVRGAMNLDVDWRNADLECDGGPRPDGNGIRLSFAGPLQSDGRRLRMVFGVTNLAEGDAGTALPTNLTVIFEGEKRLFATRGDDKCTVDKLQQERVGALGGEVRSYRVVASGFCTEPANDLNATTRIVVSSFDFAGRVTFEPPAEGPAPPGGSPTAATRISP